MAKFATDTDVPVEKSKAQIESLIMRYGATGFISGWIDQQAMISFQVHERRIRFNLPLPDRSARQFTHGRVNQHSAEHQRSPDAAMKLWEQACRQRWRALLLVIKAKLEAVECGITTFDEEFLAHIVLPGGMTVGESFLPELPAALEGRPLPPLLPPAH